MDEWLCYSIYISLEEHKGYLLNFFLNLVKDQQLLLNELISLISSTPFITIFFTNYFISNNLKVIDNDSLISCEILSCNHLSLYAKM